MKIIAINGSPRKGWNTDILLKKALEGAASAGAVTELIHLYDLKYTGCTSCLACKVKNGKSLGHCGVNDDLKPVLDAIDTCDGLILGSPIYFGDISAMLRAFFERLMFQYLSYDNQEENYFHGSMKTAFLYTMNAPEGFLAQIGYDKIFKTYESMLGRYFTYTGTLLSTETKQVEDYSRYNMAQFDGADRLHRRNEVFPVDCQRAYELGKALCCHD